jgi:hypothetical protein
MQVVTLPDEASRPLFAIFQAADSERFCSIEVGMAFRSNSHAVFSKIWKKQFDGEDLEDKRS